MSEVRCPPATRAGASGYTCRWSAATSWPARSPRRLPNGVTLLDDSYNASPEASKAALDVLAALQGRRVAVLGDMFELGDYAETGHAEVGRYVPDRADLLVTVGELGAVIARAAADAGLPAAD